MGILAATGGEDATSCGGEARTDLEPYTNANCQFLDALHEEIHNSPYCKACHGNEDDSGRLQLEECCTEACNCDDLVGGIVGILIGIVIGVIGLLMALIFMCGIMPCCCFAKDAVGQVVVAQPQQGVQMVMQPQQAVVAQPAAGMVVTALPLAFMKRMHQVVGAHGA